MLRKIMPVDCHTRQIARWSDGAEKDSNVEPLPSKSSPVRPENSSVPSIRYHAFVPNDSVELSGTVAIQESIAAVTSTEQSPAIVDGTWYVAAAAVPAPTARPARDRAAAPNSRRIRRLR